MQSKQDKILEKFSNRREELSGFNDLKQKYGKLEASLTKLDNAWRGLSDYFTGADSVHGKMMDALNDAAGMTNNAVLGAKNFKDGAEELGVDAKSVQIYRQTLELIQEFESLEKVVDDLDRQYKLIQS